MDEGESSGKRKGLTYEDAGVSITAAEEAIRFIRQAADRTKTFRVIEGIGPFGASFLAHFEDMDEPILIASTDGVGTKVKLGKVFNRYRCLGYDLVAVSVNDIITTGAIPLFFLDYIACHKVEPSVIAELVEGMCDGCLECGAALIGGEVAEMRDIYQEGEFDLAGFMVGVVDKRHRITGQSTTEGDVILGLRSSGVHANGFTLVRKVFENWSHDKWTKNNDVLGRSLVDELLTPTKIYFREIRELMQKDVEIKGIAHVSGGGISANLGRILPPGLDAIIYKNKIEVPPIFELIAREGNVSEDEMWKVFNMGVGMVLIMDDEQVKVALETASENDFSLTEIGKIVAGNQSVRIV